MVGVNFGKFGVYCICRRRQCRPRGDNPKLALQQDAPRFKLRNAMLVPDCNFMLMLRRGGQPAATVEQIASSAQSHAFISAVIAKAHQFTDAGGAFRPYEL